MIGNWSSWLNVNPEDLHDFLKNKFLRDLRTLKIGSTANLNKSEFVRYLDDVTDFLTTQFNKKEQTMNQGQYPQPQGYPPPQGAGYPQPQGYPPTQGYPQQPQSENLYVGSGKTRQTQYGGIFKLSFSADDLRKMQQYLNESGWVTIDILQRREISPSGSTHYGKIDTWRPQPQGYPPPQPQGYPPPQPQGYPQQRTTGNPPPLPQHLRISRSRDAMTTAVFLRQPLRPRLLRNTTQPLSHLRRSRFLPRRFRPRLNINTVLRISRRCRRRSPRFE